MAVVVTMVLNLLGFVMVAVAGLGLIKGRVPSAHIGNRRQAVLLAGLALVVLIIAGYLAVQSDDRSRGRPQGDVSVLP
jgi:hypothetical protein